MNLSAQLINWYLEHQRELPFRQTKDAYKIWLSEIILQQTRVNQGLRYYERFIEKYPTVHQLAQASEEEVLKMWQGLGYYSRARNLHATAQYISTELQGNFPSSFKEIQKLKGIGPYTAAAIASFAFDEPIAVVDGNVFRFFARYFGIFDDISQGKSRAVFQALGNELIDKNRPDLFNHALMDFGALICTPKKTQCHLCVFSDSCYAFRNDKVDELPVKNNKIKVKNRYFNYLIATHQNHTWICKREKGDIWQGLYEFPMIETENKNAENVQKQLAKTFKIPIEQIHLKTTNIKHKLSHQLLHINLWTTKQPIKQGRKILIDSIEEYAFPIILWKEGVEKLFENL